MLHFKCFLNWIPWTHNLGVGHSLLSSHLEAILASETPDDPSIMTPDTHPSQSPPAINQTAVNLACPWKPWGKKGRPQPKTLNRIISRHSGHVAEPQRIGVYKYLPCSCLFSPFHTLDNFTKDNVFFTSVHVIANLILLFSLLTFPNYLRKTKLSTPLSLCPFPHFPICSKTSLNSEKNNNCTPLSRKLYLCTWGSNQVLGRTDAINFEVQEN